MDIYDPRMRTFNKQPKQTNNNNNSKKLFKITQYAYMKSKSSIQTIVIRIHFALNNFCIIRNWDLADKKKNLPLFCQQLFVVVVFILVFGFGFVRVCVLCVLNWFLSKFRGWFAQLSCSRPLYLSSARCA